MAVTHGRIVAKLGAEGLLCLAIPGQRLGIAIRILDGSERARGAVALATLRQLDLLSAAELAEFERRQPQSVTNHNGWHVGEIRPAFDLRRQRSFRPATAAPV
jgi:L-asparaginase II